MGGECLVNGLAIPLQALIAAAHGGPGAAQRSRRLQASRPEMPEVDFAPCAHHIRRRGSAALPQTIPSRATRWAVTVLTRARPALTGGTLEVGDKRVKARRFVLASGSAPARARHSRSRRSVHTSTTRRCSNLASGPAAPGDSAPGRGRHGASPRPHQALGAEVTVLSNGVAPVRPGPLRSPRSAATAHAQREGVGPAREASRSFAWRARSKAGSAYVLAGGFGRPPRRTLEGSHLLVATGRSPTVADLGLEQAGALRRGRHLGSTRASAPRKPAGLAIGDGAASAAHCASPIAASHHERQSSCAPIPVAWRSLEKSASF